MGSVISPLRDNIIYVGEWQLNISLQTINDGVHARELEPLLFKLLCYFIEHNERIISRQELADNIWQQSYVDDNAINRAISELRKALKSEKQPAAKVSKHITVKGIVYLFLSAQIKPRQSLQNSEINMNLRVKSLPLNHLHTVIPKEM